jgi:hypothetical protein
MRIGWVAMALATVARAAAVDVTAYVRTEGRLQPWAAQRTAAEVLGRAGVTVGWEKGWPSGGGTGGVAVRVLLSETTPEDLLPAALAVAYPYSGCTKSITVFVDRIRQIAKGRFREETSLTGYVLAHEIAHVLQGVDRHSDAGVMKASWSLEDRLAIFKGRLEFLEDDVQLMRRGLAAGACRMPGSPVVTREDLPKAPGTIRRLATQTAGRRDSR